MAYWTIDNTGPSVGNDLDGLEIQQVFSGTPPTLSGYQLVNPPADVLASTNKTASPFNFPNVHWPDSDTTWTIHVDNGLVVGQDSNEKWTLHGGGKIKNTGNEDGSYTAQAGSVLGEEPDEASSSAKA